MSNYTWRYPGNRNTTIMNQSLHMVPKEGEVRNKQEAHGPWVTHLSDIATADMQMLCNIFPILSSQLMERSSFKHLSGQLGFPIKIILAIVDLQVTSILPMNFESIALLVQEKKFKRDFHDGRHGHNLGFPIETIWAIFDLQVIPMLPTKQVNWPFSSEQEAKNRFSRWPPPWISDQNDFS